MALPKQIKLGLYTIAVKVVKDLKNEQNKPLWGWWRPNELIIYIDKGIVGTDYEQEVLVHELIHAIHDFNELFCETVPTPDEEQVVATTAKVLVTVLKDNKKLREYLCGY